MFTFDLHEVVYHLLSSVCRVPVNAVLLQDDETKDIALITANLSAKRVLFKSGLNTFKKNGKKVTGKKSVKPIRSLRER